MKKKIQIEVDINPEEVLETIGESSAIEYFGKDHILEEFSKEELKDELINRGVYISPFAPTNLLEIQIYEAFESCVKNLNNINFLILLEDISKNGIPNLQKA